MRIIILLLALTLAMPAVQATSPPTESQTGTSASQGKGRLPTTNPADQAAADQFEQSLSAEGDRLGLQLSGHVERMASFLTAESSLLMSEMSSSVGRLWQSIFLAMERTWMLALTRAHEQIARMPQRLDELRVDVARELTGWQQSANEELNQLKQRVAERQRVQDETR